MGCEIRPATTDDAEPCAAIYRPYVLDTAVSFETEPPSVDAMARRIAGAIEWLVAVDRHEQVLGYAYAARHRERAAYRFACDVSVYLSPDARGRGLGRALYERLLDDLERRGYRMACAGIVLPNPASVGIHTALGFVPVGTYRSIGWKHGAWHDVLWMQRPLGPDGAAPAHEPL